MDEHGLAERRDVVVVVLVAHRHDRALTQARHRLVHRVGLVHADAYLARIGYQAPIEQARILRVEVLAELGGLRLPRRQRLGGGAPLFERGGRAQAGARAQERRPARETEPRLVPQENAGPA